MDTPSRNESSPTSRRDFLRTAGRATAITLAGTTLGAERALAAARRLAQPATRVVRSRHERPFNMLVFGDSIMWGQGLDEESKFSYLVEKWLEQRLGRSVRRDVFAHSGAQIGEDAKEDAKPPLHPEVPNGFPSIPAEIRAANAWLKHPLPDDPEHLAPVRPEEVSLVLLDGGINDVDIRNILTVDPTIFSATEWVRRITRRKCVGRMESLIQLVLGTYPNAKVIVTGYYPIVSRLTELGVLEELLDAFELLTVAVTALLRIKLADQSLAFYHTSTAGLREVISAAEAPAATGSVSADGTYIPGPVGFPGGRARFVNVGFQQQNSFGAPDTWLWGANAHDPAADERARACRQAGRGTSLCLWASGGHPNKEGARRYAQAIERELAQFVPEWGGTPVSKPVPDGRLTPPG